MTDLTNDQIYELRFNAAIERFASFDEYMEIPGYGVEPESSQINIEKRLEACKQRYQGMEEYMEIPDMDLWLKLKSEICKTDLQEIIDYDSDFDNYSLDSIDKRERRYLRFKDKCLENDRFD